MTRGFALLVQAAFFGAAGAVAVWLLVRHPTEPVPPAPLVSIRTVPAGPAASFPEALFADPTPDTAPGATRSGPPPLLGIVGRLSDPLVMVRGADGSVLTIGKGQAAGAWILVSVASDRVTFRRGAEERVAVLPTRDSAP
jgi:hypothetical protein